MFDPRSFHLKNRKIIVNAKCLNYLRYMYRNDVITLVTCPRIGMTSLSLASLLAPIPVQLTTMSYFCSSWKVGKDYDKLNMPFPSSVDMKMTDMGN